MRSNLEILSRLQLSKPKIIVPFSYASHKRVFLSVGRLVCQMVHRSYIFQAENILNTFVLRMAFSSAPETKQPNFFYMSVIGYYLCQTFSARLICIMKSNWNAFYVNSRRIAYDLQFVIADPNEIKTYFFATASQISDMGGFIRCLFLKKSRLAFFYSRKSIILIEFTTFTLTIKCQIIVKSWE